MSAIFITGAGTGVGKTFVTAGLIRRLRGRGTSVAAMKPIVSGFDLADFVGSDPAVLLDALEKPVTPETLAQISPWRFHAPLSPDMAARKEGHAVPFEAVIDFCRDAIARSSGVLLIEGVGGVMVPLDERHTLLDVMTRLGLPTILVGGSYLGAINHILTAQDVLKSRGLDIRAIVVSESEIAGAALEATCETLSRFSPAPVVALKRSCEAQNEPAFDRLTDLL